MIEKKELQAMKTPYAGTVRCTLVELGEKEACGFFASHKYKFGYLCKDHAKIALVIAERMGLEILPEANELIEIMMGATEGR